MVLGGFTIEIEVIGLYSAIFGLWEITAIEKTHRILNI